MLVKETYVQIGQILKNSRLKKKKTIEKISERTKISIQNLNNIENGNFHLLAGEFYQKSFIKTYCKELRISDKKLLLMLNNPLSKSNEDSKLDEKKGEKLKKIRTSLINEKIPTMPLMVLASIGLIAVFLFNFYSGTDQEDNIKMAVIEPKPEQELIKIEENVIDQTEETASIKQARIEDSDNIQNYQMQNNEIYNQQIIAKNDEWIEIKDKKPNILISTV